MFLKFVLVTLFSKNQFVYFFTIINFKLQAILGNFSVYFYFEKFEWKTYINLQSKILPIKNDFKIDLKKTNALQFTKISGLKRRIGRKFFLKTKNFPRKQFFNLLQLRKDFSHSKAVHQTWYILSRFFFFNFSTKLKKTWNFLLGNIFPYLAWTLTTVSRRTLPFKQINLKSNFSKYERVSKPLKTNTDFFLKKIFIKNFNYFNRQKLKYSTLSFKLKSLYSPISLQVKSHFSINTKPYLFLNSPRFLNYDRQMAKYYWFIFNYKTYHDHVSTLFARKRLKKCLIFCNKFRKNFNFSKEKFLFLTFNVASLGLLTKPQISKNLIQPELDPFNNTDTTETLDNSPISSWYARRLTHKIYYDFLVYKFFLYLFVFAQKNKQAQNLICLNQRAQVRFENYFDLKFEFFSVLKKNYHNSGQKVLFQIGLRLEKQPTQFKVLKFHKNLKRRLYTPRSFFIKFLQKKKIFKKTVRYKLKNSLYIECLQIDKEFGDANKLRENHAAFILFQSFWPDVRYKPAMPRITSLIPFSFYKKCRKLKPENILNTQKYFFLKISKFFSGNVFKLKKHYNKRRLSFHPYNSFRIRNVRSSFVKKYLNPVTYFTRTKTQFLSPYTGFLYLSSFCNFSWYRNMLPELKKSMFSFATRYETHRYVIKNYYKTQLFEFYNNNFIENRLLFNQALNDRWGFAGLNSLFTNNLFNVKNNAHDLQIFNKHPFETQRILDFHIKRIKFKPGYRRIWKEARAVAQTTLTVNFRYQKKFTRYLAKFQKYAHLKLLICFEMKLLNILRQSTFLYYNDIVKNFLANKLVFVNGFNCTNPNFQIFVNDFIQFVVSFSYYISYKFIINYFLKRKIKIRIRLRKKNNKASLSFEKKRSSTLPHWLLFEKNLENDVSKFFEIDFFSLSIFIVYEPFLVENLNHYEICNIKYSVLNMYNWKYIT